MHKKDFDKLKVGDKVTVTGPQDGERFDMHTGVIQSVNNSSGFNSNVRVKFDDHRIGYWSFFRDELKGKTITVAAPKASPAPAAPKKRPHGAQEYRGNGKHDWETVKGQTVRLRVPGGWLYGRRIGSSTLSQTTFVPVPQAVGYAV